MGLVNEEFKRDIAHNKDLLLADNGDLQFVEGVENVRQALLRRLITTPGALVHRPDYGVGVKDFQNAPGTLDNQRDLALRIKEQFELDFRVEEVLGMRFDVQDDFPEKTTIFVKFNLVGFGEVELDLIPFGVG